tara:strand:- start:170 stop:1141 length:972 start_codon:yes stop_codon:yes gene_type:complete
MNRQGEKKRVSTGLMVLVWAGFIVMMLSISSCVFLVHSFGEQGDQGISSTAPLTGTDVIFRVFLAFFLSSFALFCGIALYLIARFSHFFLYDYSHPVWPRLNGPRYQITNILTLLGINGGLSGFVGTIVLLITSLLGYESTTPAIFTCMGGLIVFQMITIFIDIWGPVLNAAVRRRMDELGIPADEAASATLVGISNADRKSNQMKPMIEEDAGYLWLHADSLEYKGDSGRNVSILKEQVVQIERLADKSSLEAYAGVVHIILNWRHESGAIVRTRLHTETSWCVFFAARHTDVLADRLESWLENTQHNTSSGQDLMSESEQR